MSSKLGIPTKPGLFRIYHCIQHIFFVILFTVYTFVLLHIIFLPVDFKLCGDADYVSINHYTKYAVECLIYHVLSNLEK